ncbi:MAG: arylesterase [Gammaproteobacteria bacterium]|nr:MAG: arylesterase [Gammaproteobacteria bacterium]
MFRSVILLVRLLILVFVLNPLIVSAEDRPALLILGDSLSAGYGLARNEAWAALLQRRLQEEGYPHRVINAGISGDTTRGGLARLPRALSIHQPQIVVIELGGNDGLRAIPAEEIRDNLTKLVILSRESGAKPLIAGVTLPPNYGPEYTRSFQAAFESVATEQQVPLTPFILEGIALRQGMMQDDGIHPTAAAQPLILKNLWPWIQTLLDEEAKTDRP